MSDLSPAPDGARRLALVTGATGYVGGRLVPRLLAAGFRVRVMARDPRRLAGRPWTGAVEIVAGDVLQPATLPAALADVDAAYYLIHSMGGHGDFPDRDRQAARAFGAAASAAGVAQIVYLGGLGEASSTLSEHLRSRQETGDALRAGGVPVTELRAAVIVGSGSLSFEMIRYLAERVPLMICPRWVYTRTQPIAIRDVLAYLIAALETPACRGEIVEIGGVDVVTYGEMMIGYARARGLRRWLVPVPVLTPRLSSLWVHLVTPIPAAIARPLVEGLRNEVVVRDGSARRLFPQIAPIGYDEAVRRALSKLEHGEIESQWSDALASSRGDATAATLTQGEGRILERRERLVAAPAEALFAVFSGLGGRRGWLAYDALWRLRGALDRLLGGVGLRRGRRDPQRVRVGDAVDFWRVEAVEPGRLLRLRAEMKVPGRAWLQFEAEALPVQSGETSRSRLVQTAHFAPKGLAGLAYWYALYPLHARIFSALADRIAELAIAGATPLREPAAGSPASAA
ncbi:MAG: SDR family oxidoreductase [Thermoanaerobaculia bacterium]|nr:SDR family oxidoreductase [Thermoanaerobaculia bacterium]